MPSDQVRLALGDGELEELQDGEWCSRVRDGDVGTTERAIAVLQKVRDQLASRS